MGVAVLLVTLRPALAEAFRPGTGEGWTLTVESPTDFDAAAAAPRFKLAIIDFTSVGNAGAMGRRLRRENPELEFIAIVAEERVGIAALRIGAVDYLSWPLRNPEQGKALLGQHVASAKALSLPDLGRFRLLRRLGIGGMAEVYLAEDRTHPGTQIAVKQILQGISQDPEFVTMFMDEARISAVLDHPNIVRVVDFGNIGGTYYLAMEYVAGRNLAQIARERGWRFSVRLACHLCEQIALALDYAHAKTDPSGNPLGIIHRDVNPPNILLSEDGRVLLADFGVAKARQRQTQTMHGAVKGKLEYLSPEQSLGKPIDGRSDVFSLGAVLYLLLTGVQPFAAEGPALTLMKIRDAVAPPPSTLNPEIPKRVDEIVAKALAREPKDRYATGGAFAKDLHALLATLGAVTRDEIRGLVTSEGARPVVRVEVEPSRGSVRIGPGTSRSASDPINAISEPMPDRPPLGATAITPFPPAIPPDVAEPTEPPEPTVPSDPTDALPTVARPTSAELILYESSAQLPIEEIDRGMPPATEPPPEPTERTPISRAKVLTQPGRPSPVISVSTESSEELLLGSSVDVLNDAMPTRVRREPPPEAPSEPPPEPTAITPQPRTAQSAAFDAASEPPHEPTAITPHPRTVPGTVGAIPAASGRESTIRSPSPRAAPLPDRTLIANLSSGVAPAQAPAPRGTETLAPGLDEDFATNARSMFDDPGDTASLRPLVLVVSIAIVAGLAVGASLRLASRPAHAPTDVPTATSTATPDAASSPLDATTSPTAAPDASATAADASATPSAAPDPTATP